MENLCKKISRGQIRLFCRTRRLLLQLVVVYGFSTKMGSSANSDLLKGVKYLVDTRPNMVEIPPELVLPPSLRPSLPAARVPIPIIDLRQLNGSPESRAEVVKAIGSACADWGFFQVVNHGVEESVISGMMEEVKAFFDLPWEEKAVYASNDVMSPVKFGTSLSSPHAQVSQWRDYIRHFTNAFHLWPQSPPNYKQVAKEFSEELMKLALRLVGAVSESLGLDSNYIEKSMGEGCHNVASNYYPPCPQPALILGLSAHSDNNCLVILTDNGVEGLQIKHNHEWVSVPHVPGTFGVNVGDYLEVLSNGKYKSVEHRAVVDRERLRMSFGLGIRPALSASMAPAPPLLEKGQQANFKPMNFGEYVKQQQERVVRGKSALDVVKM